jgi:hypothetical protein
MCFLRRRKAKGLGRAKSRRVPFAVRLDRKRTAKAFAVRFLAFAVRPRRTAKL